MDSGEVLELIKLLQDKGYRVWYDEGIDPGTEWDEFIAEHIQQCDFFLACISQNYLESDNCKDELNYVRDLGKARLLVYLENVELPRGMQMRLGRLQAIHKYTYSTGDQFFSKIMETKGLEVCCSRQGTGELTHISKPEKKETLTKQEENKAVQNDGEPDIFLDSRTKYEGVCRENNYTGIGKAVYENGDEYIGEFIKGHQEGKGKLVKSNGDVYEGDFTDEAITGRGTYKYASGEVYDGEFVNGEKSGNGVYKYLSGSVFTGEFKNNKKNGHGKMVYTNGEVCEGELKDDDFHGYCKRTYTNGNIFEGEYIKGKKKSGKLCFKNGDIYDGEFKNEHINGHGKMIYHNGDVYEGDFVNGVMAGNGKYTFKNGTIYKGEFKNDQITGRGKIAYFDGSTYEGEFFAGKRTGRGKLVSANGKICEGEFKNNSLVQSIKEYANGDMYEGELVDGKKEGFGKYTYKNGSVYEGSFEDDKKHGKGIMRFASGDVYKGDFFRNVKHGIGKYTFADGDVYEGGFIEDCFSGNGKMHYADGSVYEGGFRNNKKQGHGRLKASNGDLYEGEFENGFFHGRGKQLQNGYQYNGFFFNGKRNGFGIYELIDNDILNKSQQKNIVVEYIGGFKDDVFNLIGQIRYSNGDTFSGDFKNGEPCDIDEYRDANDEIDSDAYLNLINTAKTFADGTNEKVLEIINDAFQKIWDNCLENVDLVKLGDCYAMMPQEILDQILLIEKEKTVKKEEFLLTELGVHNADKYWNYVQDLSEKASKDGLSGNYDEAIEGLKKAIRIREKMPRYRYSSDAYTGMIDDYVLLSKYQIQKGNLLEAENWMKKAIALLDLLKEQNGNNKEYQEISKKYRNICYGEMADICLSRGDKVKAAKWKLKQK